MSASYAAILCLNTLPLSVSAEPAKEKVLIDFTDIRADRDGSVLKNYEYTFGSWEKHVKDLPRRGVLVQAATNKGGLGENRTMLALANTPIVELVFIIGSANQATSMNFSLEDKDGTEQQWNIPFEGMRPGPLYRCRLDLTKPSNEQKPGKIPGMNLKKIYAWQVKGDYSEPGIEVMLVMLVAPK